MSRPSAAALAIVVGLWTLGALDNPFGGRSFGIASQMAKADEAQGLYHGVGVITAIEAQSGALTIDHDEIKGLMAAMEMTYNVKSPALSQGLHKGDKIAFAVDGKSYTVLDVKVLEHAK